MKKKLPVPIFLWYAFSQSVCRRDAVLNWRMRRKFDRIYKDAKKPDNLIPLSLEEDRLVLFSDHHKGDASAADDFKKNASLYDHALSTYHKEGFRLIVLGDNEELWENRFDEVLEHYRKTIEKEIAMALEGPDGRKIRIWGNHDKEVSLRRFKKSCRAYGIKILDAVDYREGLCLEENIFLIHGHQGRFFEDRAWRISRWAVQIVWKTFQRLFNIGIDGPAENVKIRGDVERQYYQWAKSKKVLLICGHTHQAVFGSSTHFDRPLPFEDPPAHPVPCYFNSGCCGYTNGITCIEIDRGIIRLVKWDRRQKKRRILGKAHLSSIFEKTQNSPLPKESSQRSTANNLNY